jgi:hypothetical protein
MTLSTDELLTAAVAQTGLDDFGLAGWEPGFDVLVAAINREAALHPMGERVLRTQIISALSCRLAVADWVARHPEVERRPVERPLVVVGQARSGTTLLSYLLDQDPAARSLLNWEATDPVPPPRGHERRSGSRVDAAGAIWRMFTVELSPQFHLIHDEEPAGPTECSVVLAQHFTSMQWEVFANVPSYAAWLDEADYTSAYAYHRQVLQVLQSHTTNRWVLKAPQHALGIAQLVVAYPDADVVFLHRDPAAVVPSLCSLIGTMSAAFSDADHDAHIARRWTGFVETTTRRVHDCARSLPDRCFVDVAYDDLVAHPLDVVREIYRRRGETLSDEAVARMECWLGRPDADRGRHDYRSNPHLDAAVIADRFAWYRRS